MRVRVASAGTGKTTSLVLRYLELIEGGTPLRRIAGVTFTRTAAHELRQRVGAGVEALLERGTFLDRSLTRGCRAGFEEARLELDGAVLGTIHGFMIAALRLAAPTMGLDPDFGVLGEWEAEALFEEEVGSLLYLAGDPGHGLHDAVATLGEEAPGLLLALFGQRSLVERFECDDHPRNNALLRLFEHAYRRFELRLGARLLPPGEVERRALRLVRTPAALARLGERFRVVLVDEFQDVNPLQGSFFEALEAHGMVIEVVGDPKQSIYGFRNADVEVFRRAMRAAEPRGELLPALTDSRRHAQVVARFLNALTGTLAEAGLGFGPAEAPPVAPAGGQAAVRGRLEIHWVAGDAPIGELREREAEVLAERLAALAAEGRTWNEMAVLARSYAGLAQAEAALQRAGLPYVLLQGRGYYERLEIRDLYHALRVGIEPKGHSFAAWLRSPFAQLPLDAVAEVLGADDPPARLRERHPEVADRLDRIGQSVRGAPLAALKTLIRAPFIGGRRYIDFLGVRERENVDALLFTAAQQPPGDLEVLLDRLDLLSRQRDAGDVPQSGEGISLLTVHRAKGLEWPVVAVFDAGRKSYTPPRPLHLDGSFVCCHGTDGFEPARAALVARDDEESYRLLYVAASRPRDVLLVTGSVKEGRCDGWARALELMGLGPDAEPYRRADFVLATHGPAGSRRDTPPPSAVGGGGLPPAPWIDRAFPLALHPPVHSPSRLKGEGFEDAEPLPIGDPDEGERLPGRATVVGTLVHFAISQNWRADDARQMANLRAQEVMFPFTPDEQDDILAEVAELLHVYQGMLGRELPALAERSEDHPELPMAIPDGATVWQGIIDRLYCAAGEWVLEDYKTDRELQPERYHFQLAVYLRAVQAVRGVTPRVQLVYLRAGRVVAVEPKALEAAYRQALGAPATGSLRS